MRTIIRHSRLFDGAQLTPATDLAFENGYISEIGQLDVRENDQIIEAAGQTLLPGYIDAHIHITGLDNLKQSVRCGITTMMDMQPTSVELVDSLRDLPGLPALTTCASVAVGPGGLLPQVVIIRDEDVMSADPQDGVNFVRRMVSKGAEYIKVILERPPLTEKMLTVEQVRAIVEESHKHGKLVFVHTTSTEAWQTALVNCSIPISREP